MSTIDITRLRDPFEPQDLEWRILRAGKNKKGIWAQAVAYVTNRAIQARLDDVVGPFGWKNEYREWHGSAQICGISIWCSDRDGWVTKWDGAENTDIEAVKGGLSDSMKRAAVQWGIGRYLYEEDAVWVDVFDHRVDGSQYANLPKNAGGDAFHWRLPVSTNSPSKSPTTNGSSTPSGSAKPNKGPAKPKESPPDESDDSNIWSHTTDPEKKKMFRRAFNTLGVELGKANLDYPTKVFEAFEKGNFDETDMDCLRQVVAWHVRAQNPNHAIQMADLFEPRGWINPEDAARIRESSQESLKGQPV